MRLGKGEIVRKHFDLHSGEPFLLEVDNNDGSTFFIEFRDASVAAQIGNLHANIFDSIRSAGDGRYFRLTLVGDEDQIGVHGVQKGWYVARWVSVEDAQKYRKSWSILRQQSLTDPFNLPD